MIVFRSSANIRRSPEAVFHFLANVDRVQQAGGSPVLALDRTTSEPPGLGSRYREVVRMLPFYKGEFVSEITAFEPPRLLEMAWTGPAMAGRDRYELAETQDGTALLHQKWTSPRGLLRMMEPFMRRALLPRLEERLGAIKRALEEGLGPIPESTSPDEDR
jgi:uncharacterized protein YndB with AHSA1/START domain